jgi:hypothetical protein
MPQCRLCDKEKPEAAFRVRGGGRNGLQSDCTECTNSRAREYRQQTRDRVGQYKLDKGCECCGFKATHPCQLDLDHLDPNTKTYKGSHKSYDAGWSWERVEREISLCQVLCKNCHALRTYEERHWENFHTTIRMRQSSAQT